MRRLQIPLFFLFLGLTANCVARPEDKLNSIIEDCEHLIDHWEMVATITLSIIVLIGVLGVVVGVLQKLNKSWSAIAVIVTGGAISVLTIVQTNAFKTDYRVLRVKAAEARKLVSDMSLIEELFLQAQDKENKIRLLEKFRENKDKIYELNQKLYAKSESFDFFPTAYAQTEP